MCFVGASGDQMSCLRESAFGEGRDHHPGRVLLGTGTMRGKEAGPEKGNACTMELGTHAERHKSLWIMVRRIADVDLSLLKASSEPISFSAFL